MTTLLGPLLAVVLLAQAPTPAQTDRTVAGTVIDHEGKPIAGATVEMEPQANPYLPGEPARAEAAVKVLSDSNGRFKLRIPSGRIFTTQVRLWAHQPGRAVATEQLLNVNEIGKPPQIVLWKPEPRTVKVEGPDGKPVVGARVEPRSIGFPGGPAFARIPASLASPLAVTTGPDGTATVAYLARQDRLVGARLTVDAIAEQDLPVAEEIRNGPLGPTVVIKLKKTSRLSGRILDEAGKGVAGQTVDVWCRVNDGIFASGSVAFKNGPVRTAADGSFQTPDNLMIGSSYRVGGARAGQGTHHLRLDRNHRTARDTRPTATPGGSFGHRPSDRPARKTRRQR